MQEYHEFRAMSINEAAVTLAGSGKIGALNLLFKRHPFSLTPFMLEVLGAIPEKLPVQTYGQLLPGKSPPTSDAVREDDWVECEKMVNFISRLPKNNEIGIQIRTEPTVKRCQGYVWPSTTELSRWYKNKLDICLMVIEEACRDMVVEEGWTDFQNNVFFKDEVEAVDCALQCIYMYKPICYFLFFNS